MKPARIANLILDSVDPEAIVPFWSELLGLQVADRLREGEYVEFAVPAEGKVVLMLQRVPEDKVGKNRMHMDLEVEDLEEATAEIERLGGRWDGQAREQDGFPWRIMTHPQGNEFCILLPG